MEGAQLCLVDIKLIHSPRRGCLPTLEWLYISFTPLHLVKKTTVLLAFWLHHTALLGEAW